MRGPLFGALILLALVQLLSAADNIRRDWSDMRAAAVATELKGISTRVLAGAQQVAFERGHAARRLAQADPIDPAGRRELDGARAAAARHLEAALQALEEQGSPEEWRDGLAAMRDSVQAIEALRPEVDRALELPREQRPPNLIDRWVLVTTDLVRQLVGLLSNLNQPFLAGGPEAVRLEMLFQRGLALRDEAGRDKLALLTALLREMPVTGEERDRLLAQFHGLEVHWRDLEQLAAGIGDPRINSAMATARRLYMERFREARLAAIRSGGRLSADELVAFTGAGVVGLNALTDVVARAVERSNVLVAERRNDAIRRLGLSVLELFLSLAAMAAALAIVHYWVLKPIGGLSASMRALAAGDLDHPVPDYDRGGEIKEMTNAVEVFKRNARQLDEDTRERGLAQALLTGEREILEMTARRAPLSEVLGAICLAMERQLDGGRCCILLVRPDGKALSVGAAPSFDTAFRAAADGWPIGADCGSCGTAIFRGEPVLVSDIATDARWTRFREAAQGMGLAACWSFPIRNSQREPVGTFSCLFPSVRAPAARDEELCRRAANLAAIVVGNRRAEEELEQAKAAAELGSRTKSEFLANMSHELRTPLNAIIGFAEVLDSELRLSQGPSAGYAADIAASGRHLLNLINDILDVSKLEAGRVELRERICGVADLLAGCERIVRARALERRIDLSMQIPGGLPPVLVDDVKIKQVILNLLSNAVKFTAPGGSVAITVDAEPAGGLVIAVADTGIGIKPEDLERVFVPFHQVDNIYARLNPGTGLGLALSRGLAELHGGKLTMDSVYGQGTTVSLFIPASRIMLSDFADTRLPA